jgi:hypothetical protein
MSDIQSIRDHYEAALSGSPWHGDPVWQVLDGVSAQEAAARPLANRHTIWEIVMHMIFWEGVVTKRLAGQRAGLVEELNFPAMPSATEENWQQTLADFRTSNQEFRDALGKLYPAKLGALSAAGKRTYSEEAYGIVEHHLYHLGQIALLRK